MSKQPVWKYLANLGDVNYLDYGGYFIFEDETGVYSPEGEYLDVWEDETIQIPSEEELTEWEDENIDYLKTRYTVYRFTLDKLNYLNGRLINDHILDGYKNGTLPHPIERYDEWFTKDLRNIANSFDLTEQEIINKLCSNDVLERAFVYREIGLLYGFENLDDYSLKLDYQEAIERYNKHPYIDKSIP